VRRLWSRGHYRPDHHILTIPFRRQEAAEERNSMPITSYGASDNLVEVEGCEVRDVSTVAEIRSLFPAGTRVRLSAPSGMDGPDDAAMVAVDAGVLLERLRDTTPFHVLCQVCKRKVPTVKGNRIRKHRRENPGNGCSVTCAGSGAELPPVPADEESEATRGQ
jgi:hypothetical protein